ncbi:glycosyltransferase family 2 protein [Devosia rhizoryzae]|uniref:Glycosyltransferase family 2 protein n=1 Tax=Devosia rhizoryzae TaxID=2774137 RepID=A0ABX7C403_9HYPH|nr:glycosyltransferase family A protein [Devosia rhizoryzae]QQR38959.1 glycosyltransferase family 2 protein [Devosia rhizoryzae]
MGKTVAIITPAFKAQETLPETVRSVLEQTHGDWQHWIIADDGFDYASFLDQQGLGDKRQVFATTGRIGSGASQTRNVALEQLATPYAAILDADDRLKGQKLERAVDALDEFGIVTTALDVVTTGFSHLRFVGDGPDRKLTAGEHKWVNLSMDSMVVWDRRRADGRYDPTIRNMNDLDFLLQLFRTVPQSFHLGTPLHDYVKRDGSLSNGAETAAAMIHAKTAILDRLEAGYYGLSADDVAGVAGFLRVSLAAEAAYGDAVAARPGLLFEDHLEPRLRASKPLP